MTVSYFNVLLESPLNFGKKAVKKLAVCLIFILDQVHFIPRKSERCFEKRILWCFADHASEYNLSS